MARVRYRGPKQQLQQQQPRRHSDTQHAQTSANNNSVGGVGKDGEYIEDAAGNEAIWAYDELPAEEDPLFHNAKLRRSMLKQLVASRLFLLLFQCIINWVMVDYQTDAFKGVDSSTDYDDYQHYQAGEKGAEGADSDKNNSSIKSFTWAVNFALSGLARWDAQHFLHVARFGYSWESQLAFQPAWPVVLRLLGRGVVRTMAWTGIFASEGGAWPNSPTAMLVGGVVFNNTLFVVNGLLLYRLAYRLTGDVQESVVAVYVYCWNPASIFFSSLYSEPLYFYFTLVGMLVVSGGHLQSDGERLLAGAFVFAAALVTRANGLINIGFIAWPLLVESVLREYKDEERGKQWLGLESSWATVGKKLAHRLPLLLVCLAVMSLPMRIVSHFVENQFCHSARHAPELYQHPALLAYIDAQRASSSSPPVLPGQLDQLDWCPPPESPTRIISSDGSANATGSAATAAQQPAAGGSLLMPAYYTAVQEKYWQVQWLGYWQWRKVPFFLAAAPTLLLVLFGAGEVLAKLNDKGRRFEEVLVERRTLVPYALHSLFISFAGLLFYNVEVSTRLLFASSPFLYIVLARSMLRQMPESEEDEAGGGGGGVAGVDHSAYGDVVVHLTQPGVLPFLSTYVKQGVVPLLVFSYLLGYYIFGTMFHVNWLPFL